MSARHEVRRMRNDGQFCIDWVYPTGQGFAIGGLGCAFYESETVEKGWADEKEATYRAMELDKKRTGKSKWTPESIERFFQKRAEREERRKQKQEEVRQHRKKIQDLRSKGFEVVMGADEYWYLSTERDPKTGKPIPMEEDHTYLLSRSTRGRGWTELVRRVDAGEIETG